MARGGGGGGLAKLMFNFEHAQCVPELHIPSRGQRPSTFVYDEGSVCARLNQLTFRSLPASLLALLSQSIKKFTMFAVHYVHDSLGVTMVPLRSKTRRLPPCRPNHTSNACKQREVILRRAFKDESRVANELATNSCPNISPLLLQARKRIRRLPPWQLVCGSNVVADFARQFLTSRPLPTLSGPPISQPLAPFRLHETQRSLASGRSDE